MSLSRVRALAIMGALVVCAIILAIVAIAKDKQTTTSYGGCPSGSVKVKTKPLPDEKTIKINIYNGAGTPGLARSISDELSNRKFIIGDVKDSSAAFDGVAKLRYGPKALAAATVVNAYFLGKADDGSGYDPKDTTDAVDITIGKKYTALGTPTDVHQAIAQLGNPSPPAGTCDISTAG
jgi:LytR cell envelope-related transcriptional attenuator